MWKVGTFVKLMCLYFLMLLSGGVLGCTKYSQRSVSIIERIEQSGLESEELLIRVPDLSNDDPARPLDLWVTVRDGARDGLLVIDITHRLDPDPFPAWRSGRGRSCQVTVPEMHPLWVRLEPTPEPEAISWATIGTCEHQLTPLTRGLWVKLSASMFRQGKETAKQGS